jgi:hypothetical protein
MSEASPEIRRGGCVCGAVRYEVRGPMRGVLNCHCTSCRRWHGHYGAYAGAPRDRLVFVEQRGLRWYRMPSGKADRGFCGECGSSLFWSSLAPGSRNIGIAAGTLDSPTGLRTVAHEFIAFKGDYYTIDDGLEQRAED